MPGTTVDETNVPESAMRRGGTLYRLSRSRARSVVGGPRRRAERGVDDDQVAAPTPSRRTSLDGFARRAAAETTERQTEVLEVGVGEQSFRSLFPGGRYRSISIEPERPGAAYAGYLPKRPIDTLPVATGGFGVVLCSGVLDRTPEPQGIMAELSRALRCGGQLFLTAPLIVPEPNAARLPGRQRFGLNYLLDASGFAIEDLLPVERSSSYAVVARKQEPPGGGRRRSDRLGAVPLPAGFQRERPRAGEGTRPTVDLADRTTRELPPIV